MSYMTVTVAPTTLATEQDLQLDLFLDGSAWEGLFDSLEIWRSRGTAQGPYEPLTGAGWQPALLPRGGPPPPASPQTGPSATLVGKSLTLLVNEAVPLTVLFSGTDPLTYAQAAAQIRAQGQQRLQAYVNGNLLVVQTAQSGSVAILRITGGDAAPTLGLTNLEPGSLAFGLDARVPLRPGITDYRFTDHNGDASYFYKTRFFNQLTQTASDFSLPFSGALVSVLRPADLVRATVDLVDATGVALANRAVLLAPRALGTQLEGKTLVDGSRQVLTDAQGHAEFRLVRGQAFTIAIAGTDLVRDFTAPVDPTVLTFDMLDPSLGTNDVFNVQVPALNFATRRSL